MYHFSRAIYRELAPLVVEDERDRTRNPPKQLVLDACEYTIRRVVYDRGSIANPARFLFGQIRGYFRLRDLPRVWRIIQRDIGVALETIDRLPQGRQGRRTDGADVTSAA
jgi:hypothetical protein